MNVWETSTQIDEGGGRREEGGAVLGKETAHSTGADVNKGESQPARQFYTWPNACL